MKQILPLVQDRYQEILSMIAIGVEKGGLGVTIEKYSEKKARTSLQNASMHKYFTLLATALNEAGYTFKTVMNRRANEAIKNAIADITKTDELEPKQKGYVLSWMDFIQDSLLVADCDWTRDLVKNNLWRPVQKSLYEKESTTQLDTKECQEVYKQLDRFMSESFGVHIEWPSIDSMSEQQRKAA